MKRCTRCLMPETARNIEFDDNGLCLACQRMNIDKNYDSRLEEFRNLCDKYRCSDHYYDCIIPVSGGKDSFMQVYWMKKRMNMHPLLVSVTDEFEHTNAGKNNIKQLIKSFRCDLITLTLNPEMVRETTRYGFENIGSTNWAIDKAIYTWPLQQAIKLNIPLVVYGENVEWEYGCKTGIDTWSAKKQIENNVVNINCDMPLIHYEKNCLDYPSIEEIEKIEPIYLSYFMKWDGISNAKLAEKYGFRSLKGEWERVGFIDYFWQIDSVGYLMNYYLKFAKYGYSKATDVASHLIRYNYIDRNYAIDFIKKEEGCLDQRILNDFLKFTEYSDQQFWEIMGKWFDPEIFEYKNYCWKLKEEYLL